MQVIGERLHCVFVDNGLLRLDEGARVMATFAEQLHLPVTKVDARASMMARLKGVTDPEAKRKAIGAEFIDCFKRFRCVPPAAVCPVRTRMRKFHGIHELRTAGLPQQTSTAEQLARFGVRRPCLRLGLGASGSAGATR